jgi:hypothetical protein
MSNPTTPFNWQMPTNTDLVTDLPADFEVFGQAVATSMADLLGGTSGQILSKASNADMDFTWIANDQGDITGVTATSPLTGGGTSGAITVGIQASSTTQSGAVQLSDSTSTTSSVLAATPTAVKSAYDLAAAAIPKSTVTTAGDVIYATGSAAVTRLGIGTAGQVLTVNGGGTAPSWATPAAAGGKIAQVIQTVKTDTFTSTSTSFTDITGLSVSITPTSASSTILVSYSVVGASSATTSDSIGSIRLMRGATAIGIGDTASNRQRATGSISTRETNATTINFTAAGNFLDSPATTSATTYKIQGITGAGTFFINRTQGDADAASSYRTISTITVMEVLP